MKRCPTRTNDASAPVFAMEVSGMGYQEWWLGDGR